MPDPSADEEPSLEELLATARQEGQRAGRLEADAEWAPERQRLIETVATLSTLRRTIAAEADRDLMELAVGMARRILHREVQLDADILLAMARVALQRLGPRAAATIYLHPDDLAGATAQTLGDGICLEADPRLQRGGCRIESDRGEIDLGIEAQVSELSRQLLGDHRHGDGDHLH